MPRTIEYASQPISAERGLQELQRVQAGTLLFLNGTLPTEGRTAKFVGGLGAELGVATERNVSDLPKVADEAFDFLQDVFGTDKNPTRLVYGVASLPLGTPVEAELIFEVRG